MNLQWAKFVVFRVKALFLFSSHGKLYSACRLYNNIHKITSLFCPIDEVEHNLEVLNEACNGPSPTCPQKWAWLRVGPNKMEF